MAMHSFSSGATNDFLASPDSAHLQVSALLFGNYPDWVWVPLGCHEHQHTLGLPAHSSSWDCPENVVMPPPVPGCVSATRPRLWYFPFLGFPELVLLPSAALTTNLSNIQNIKSSAADWTLKAAKNIHEIIAAKYLNTSINYCGILFHWTNPLFN